jgi:hypothetical protein
MLFESLDAFFQEHQYCGELDGGVDGDRVWMTCMCGYEKFRMRRILKMRENELRASPSSTTPPRTRQSRRSSTWYLSRSTRNAARSHGERGISLAS